MKAHRLAEWLLAREDKEVFFCVRDWRKEPPQKDFYISVMSPAVDGTGDVILSGTKVPTEAENKAYHEKLAIVSRTHPDRMPTSSEGRTGSEKEFAEAFIKEAKSKGYTVLPANDPTRDRYGVVVYKEVEGVELAYNPSWPVSEGKLSEGVLEDFFYCIGKGEDK